MWIAYAFGSALFAGLTSILAKRSRSPAHHCGAGVLLAHGAGTGADHNFAAVSGKTWCFLLLSGLTAGASWLCYYKALKDGLASVVVPIDKLSILVTIVFSYVVFHETLTRKALIGLLLIVGGTLLMLV